MTTEKDEIAIDSETPPEALTTYVEKWMAKTEEKANKMFDTTLETVVNFVVMWE